MRVMYCYHHLSDTQILVTAIVALCIVVIPYILGWLIDYQNKKKKNYRKSISIRMYEEKIKKEKEMK